MKLSLGTRSRGLLPDFVIIGVQRGGTTTLYEDLLKHPGIRGAKVKEVHYFDNRYWNGEDWYRKQFPTEDEESKAEAAGTPFISGEASPYYIFHPHAARRMRLLIPNAKLVALLRNPVDRAYSHYSRRVKKGGETLGFEEALDAEEGRLKGELEHMVADEHYNSYRYRTCSYKARGRYSEQLEALYRVYPKEQVLVIKSEDLFEKPKETYAEVVAFLGAAAKLPESFSKVNVGHYPAMKPETRRSLLEYFAPHNEALRRLTGRDFGWAD
jgi:Sulfotransferase domain